MLNLPLRAFPSIAITATLLFGCSGSGTISYVKDGSLDDCPDVTLGQMADSYMDQPNWESFEADDGLDYVNLIGSSIAYRPPVGTQLVIYKFNFHMSGIDETSIAHFKLFLDDDEVTKARCTMGADNNSTKGYNEGRRTIEWPFLIGGDGDATAGKVAADPGWDTSTSLKTIKVKYRDYSASYELRLHETYHWDGGASSQLAIPTISITAIN